MSIKLHVKDRLSNDAVADSIFRWAGSMPGIALYLFTAGAMFLDGQNQQRILGFILGLCAIGTLLSAGEKTRRKILSLPAELLIYFAWILWCLTGLAVVKSLDSFWATYSSVIQVGLATVFTWILMRARPYLVNAFLFGLLTGVFVQIFYIIISGDFILDGNARVSGLSNNPNGLGMLLILGTIGALLIVPFLPVFRRAQNQVLIVLIALFSYTILLTGSRKSLLAIGILIGLWLLWAYSIRGKSSAIWARIILSIFFICGLYFYVPWLLDNTLVGSRFLNFLGAGGGSLGSSVEENIRYDMYIDGFKMFASNPIYGVGLGNFTQHFYTGHYSHSDYIEPLATTGLIGFFLYHAFHAGLTIRIIHALKKVTDPEMRYRIKVCAISLSVFFLLGIGSPFMTSHLHFMFLVSIWIIVSNASQLARKNMWRFSL